MNSELDLRKIIDDTKAKLGANARLANAECRNISIAMQDLGLTIDESEFRWKFGKLLEIAGQHLKYTLEMERDLKRAKLLMANVLEGGGQSMLPHLAYEVKALDSLITSEQRACGMTNEYLQEACRRLLVGFTYSNGAKRGMDQIEADVRDSVKRVEAAVKNDDWTFGRSIMEDGIMIVADSRTQDHNIRENTEQFNTEYEKYNEKYNEILGLSSPEWWSIITAGASNLDQLEKQHTYLQRIYSETLRKKEKLYDMKKAFVDSLTNRGVRDNTAVLKFAEPVKSAPIRPISKKAPTPLALSPIPQPSPKEVIKKPLPPPVAPKITPVPASGTSKSAPPVSPVQPKNPFAGVFSKKPN